jgi:hypothetical protein
VTQNGYWLFLDPPVELQTLWDLIEDFRERATAILHETLYRRVARAAAQVIDQRALELPSVLGGRAYHRSDKPLEVAYRLVLGSYQDAWEADAGADQELEAHLTVFPGPDILALLHTRNEAVQAAWEATAGVEPFPYLRPRDASEAEWAVRSGIWEHALARPSAGLRTECFGRWGLPVPTIEDVLPYVPVRKDRAAFWGVDRALGDWLRRQAVTDDRHIPYVVLQGFAWLREESEGNAAARGEAEEIEPLLPLIDYESFSV